MKNANTLWKRNHQPNHVANPISLYIFIWLWYCSSDAFHRRITVILPANIRLSSSTYPGYIRPSGGCLSASSTLLYRSS